jgi:hypothetical protein
VVKTIEGMEKEAKSIRTEILKLCWYMRGGITYEQAMHLSFSEREIINGIIKENLDTTKKTGLNFFFRCCIRVYGVKYSHF